MNQSHSARSPAMHRFFAPSAVGWRAVLADRLDDLPMPPLLPLHVHGDDGMGGRHQQQDVEHQAENNTKHDQDEVQHCRKRLPVQQQPYWRQQSSKDIDHIPFPAASEKRAPDFGQKRCKNKGIEAKMGRFTKASLLRRTAVTQDLGTSSASAMVSLGTDDKPQFPTSPSSFFHVKQ
jgi:hypothetical protein